MARSSAVNAMRHCAGALAELRRCAKLLPGSRVSLTEGCEELLDKFQECVALSFVPLEEVERARRYVQELNSLLSEVTGLLGGRGWALPRETSDFSRDPLEHLKKKITLYTYDLLRRKTTITEYASKARSALGSSMRSNLRIVYEVYVLASVVKHLAGRGARIVYPEHKFVHFDRQGKQASGSIPPNLAVELDEGVLSFFLEAPRPLGWRGLKDLSRVWRFYVTLRPDIMVYSGLVLDIVDPSSNGPPVKRPDVIIECKELEDWYARTRELKGPVNPSLSFSEWFRRWLSGLWSGLADVLGVDPSVVREVAEGERRGVRVTEAQLVKFYKAFYDPRRFYLVSSPRLPGYVRSDLESSGIVVYDGVRVGDPSALKDLAEELLGYASPIGEPREHLRRVREALRSAGVELGEEELARLLAEFALSRLSEFRSFAAARKAETAA
ncbi:hypothetical protein [Thermogladius sp.]|uniref:hypothetical protein n=1 Tax=Thermogladius sp. TaxID=2023064 RepID=UPI003D119044